MARMIIIEDRKALDKVVRQLVMPSDEPHVWLWDSSEPDHRTYIGGSSPAYVVGDKVQGPPDWGPTENEVAFIEQTEGS